MKKIVKQINSEIIILGLILIVFITIYSLISLVNHYLFRTYALDLGMFNHAIYSFAHLKMNYFTLDISGAEPNYFGDHFSLITLLYAPFYYITGSYTLLIIQILSIIFGGLGIYKVAKYFFSSEKFLPHLFLLQFFLIWGIYSALSFDFHNNVVASMFIPWLFLMYLKNDKKLFLIVFFLILISKENMALWLSFIITALLLRKYIVDRENFKINEILKFEIPLIVFSLLYFIIVVAFVMPLLNKGEGTNQLARYQLLGNSFSEIITTMIKHPKYLFFLMFESPLNDNITNGIKSELHFMVLVSGGFFLFYRPWYLLMLLPIYAQKMFSNDCTMWGINNQYSIEFVPILSLCLIDGIKNSGMFHRKIFKYLVIFFFIFSTGIYTYKTMKERKSLWYNQINTDFTISEHYKTPYNVREIRNILKTIPNNAIISVSSALAPHLAFRDKIYHFPIIKDAEYIVLLIKNSTPYPLTHEQFNSKISELKNSSHYSIEYENDYLLILKRR